MTTKEFINRKKELGLTNKTISEMTGIPLGTVQRIFSGKTIRPRKDTLRLLENLLQYPKDSEGIVYLDSVPDNAAALRDALASYHVQKRQGEYTIEDYFALPDNIRAELIDGVFYAMGAPSTWHQAIAGYIHKLFLDYVTENKGPCYPLIAPVDVQLDEDDDTMMQPDVMIICDRKKYQKGRIFGAPDLVIEVLSPSSRKYDMQHKLYKYGNAGVREYWIVDPKKKSVIQYDLENMNPPVIYTFSDNVPVLIWDGRCTVDFKALYDSVSFLMDLE